MNFNNKLPEWKNSGTEPSDSLKNDGFKAGYKPSANVFNWFWSLEVSALLKFSQNCQMKKPQEQRRIRICNNRHLQRQAHELI